VGSIATAGEKGASSRVALVTGGLIKGNGKWALHPTLMPWQPALLRRRQRWFHADLHNPLSLLAAIMAVPAARLLADDSSASQYWVVTPWHGQAMRDRVRLMPAALLDWHQQDADWLKGQLQPLLDDLMMELVVQLGGGMVMRCANPLHVQPLPYPHLEQKGLTNRHPNGADGGILMRLLAEIQMSLHQQVAAHRNNKIAIHGVWLWGGWQPEADVGPVGLPNIACRDLQLQRVCDGRDPQWLIGTAEEMVQMLPDHGEMPAVVVLTGEGRALCLAGRRWFSFGEKRPHERETLGEESTLWQMVKEH